MLLYSYNSGALSVGVNPKINNMLTGYQAAQYELLWFTDANIISMLECVINKIRLIWLSTTWHTNWIGL